MHRYRFTGSQPEDFPYLPADPPARHLKPGDTVDCFEPVDHARLELLGSRSKDSAPRKRKPKPARKNPKPTPTAEPSPASSKTEA